MKSEKLIILQVAWNRSISSRDWYDVYLYRGGASKLIQIFLPDICVSVVCCQANIKQFLDCNCVIHCASYGTKVLKALYGTDTIFSLCVYHFLLIFFFVKIFQLQIRKYSETIFFFMKMCCEQFIQI